MRVLKMMMNHDAPTFVLRPEIVFWWKKPVGSIMFYGLLSAGGGWVRVQAVRGGGGCCICGVSLHIVLRLSCIILSFFSWFASLLYCSIMTRRVWFLSSLFGLKWSNSD